MSSIRAVFTAGLDAIIVHGLHQWDYGRSLEISHPDLPTTVEVHFGTAVSKEAIVHVAAGVSGTATVAIPNSLLEQAHPVTAWVYLAEDTLGKTLLTVTLPIQARPRPATAPSVIPEEIGDRYTEALAAMNAAVASVREGDVTAARALTAANAAYANQAECDKNGNVIDATKTEFAERANEAATATSAFNDGNGDNIAEKYASFKGSFRVYGGTNLANGTYQFKVSVGTYCLNTIIEADTNTENAGMLGTPGDGWDYMLTVAGGKPVITAEKRSSDVQTNPASGMTIYYRRID